MKKEKDFKPVYEAPKVFRLDETDSMFGQCETGSNATGNCNPTGGTATNNCDNGTSASNVCNNGNTAVGNCAPNGGNANV